MARLGPAGRLVCGMGAMVLLGLFVPAGAMAKLPVESDPFGGPPGLTVTGIGFGPAAPEATARAVRDARRLAGSIARTLRLDLGDAETVELPELTQFGAVARSCRGKRTAGCRRPPTAVAATVTYAIAGGATGEAARSVRAHGSASAAVRSDDRSRNRSIKRAVLAARRAVVPAAALDAWRSARVAADAANLRLGAIVSVEQTAPLYYGSSFYDAALGSFDPGRFCGTVRVPVLRRDPETGEREVVRRVPRRRCFVPSPYSVNFAIEYEAG